MALWFICFFPEVSQYFSKPEVCLRNGGEHSSLEACDVTMLREETPSPRRPEVLTAHLSLSFDSPLLVTELVTELYKLIFCLAHSFFSHLEWMTLDGNCEPNIDKVNKNWKQVLKRGVTCLFDFTTPENCWSVLLNVIHC